jgi:aryl-alcohol dehydrogenase-like predicted oxidoreductase
VGAFGGGLLTGKYRNNEQGRLTSQAAIGQQEDTGVEQHANEKSRLRAGRKRRGVTFRSGIVWTRTTP